MSDQSIEEFTEEEKKALAAMEADEPLELSEPEEEVEASEEAVTEEQKEDRAGEEPEAAPEPEASAEAKPPEGFVPHQAMHSERQKRKLLEAEVAELKKKFEQDSPKDPIYADPILDPEGHRRWAEHQTQQNAAQIQQMQQRMQEQQQMQERAQRAASMEAEFKKTHDDYDTAAQFLMQSRISELRGMGYGDAEIQQTISREANNIVTSAEGMGMNPAQIVYMQAQQRGYQKAAPVAPATPQIDPAQKLAATARAQQQTQGAQSVGGGGGELTMETIANMSEAEIAKLPPDALEKALGG